MRSPAVLADGHQQCCLSPYWTLIWNFADAIHESEILSVCSLLAAEDVHRGGKEKVTGEAMYGVRVLDDVGGVQGHDSAVDGSTFTPRGPE